MAYKFNPFTGKLEEYGPILTGTGTVAAAADGTAALPGISFANDLSVGIYRPGPEQLALSTNGTGRLFITSAGLVGIGTSSVSANLHVASAATASALGTIRIDGADTAGAVNAPVTLNAATQGTAGQGGSQFYIETRISGGGLTRALTVDSSQRVGIGTTSPDGGLHVKRSASGGQAILDNGGEDYTALDYYNNGIRKAAVQYRNTENLLRIDAFAASSQIAFRTVDTERARIDTSGRLLVGTSTAESATIGGLVQIQATGSSAALLIKRNSANAIAPYIYLAKSRGANNATTIVASGDSLGELRFAGADGSSEVGSLAALIKAEVDGTPGANDMPGRLVFSTTADGASSPTERMRITSDAYVRLASGTGGIQFNGDTAAANALDDYEEGTCFASTGNWTNTAETNYTKVGRYVFINFRGTVATSSQTLSLPFTSSYADCFSGWSDIDGTPTKLILSSATQITLEVGFHKGFLQYQTT